MATVEFDEVRRRIYSVYVYDTNKRVGAEKPRWPSDAGCKRASTTGSGTPASPYRYDSGLRCSWQFAAIDLWCAYRPGLTGPEVFARIDELYVIFTHEGIRALDGKFTKLAP